MPNDPQVLISVRNATEAEIALRFPLGVLDLKDPDQGALGLANEGIRREFLSVAKSRAVTSVALGELTDWAPNQIAEPEAWKWLHGFQYAKIGLAGAMAGAGAWQRQWAQLHQSLPPATTLVAVAYADWQVCDAPPIESVMECVTSKRPHWPVLHRGTSSESDRQTVLLLDTHSKSRGNLVDLLGWERIESLIHQARHSSCKLVVAGSLGLEHLPQLLRLAPDFIGFRGAVCEQGRSLLSQQKLLELFECWNDVRAKSAATR